MMKRAMTLWVVVAVAVITGAAQANFILFDDEYLNVTTTHSFGSLYDSSMADVRAGGDVYRAYVNDEARLNVIGGHVDTLLAWDNSQITLLDGSVSDGLQTWQSSRVTIDGSFVINRLTAYDNSQITLLGGSVSDRLLIRQSSQLTMSGGSGNIMSSWENSQVTISGGSIEWSFSARGNSQVTISGGSIGGGISARDSSKITISGGSIAANLRAYHSSEVTVSGGLLGRDIWVGSRSGSNDSTITFVGSNFAIDGASVEYGEYGTGGLSSLHGTLTGTLANGDLLNNDFDIYDGSSIVLVPEPAIQVAIDIKPGSDSNPLRVNFIGKGVYPVAIIGEAGVLDVTTIDENTATLEGVAALRGKVEDVNQDGVGDLVLKFDRQAILDALEAREGALGDLPNRKVLTLTLFAESSAEPVTGTDTLVILNRGAIKRKK